MTVRVYTAGKVPKARGVSACAAVLHGLPDGPATVTTTHRPPHPSPNSAHMHALALGVAAAVRRGADTIEVYSPSKNAVRAVDGTGGATYATREDALAAGWVIHYRCDRCRATFTHRPARDMPEAIAAADAALAAEEGVEQFALAV